MITGGHTADFADWSRGMIIIKAVRKKSIAPVCILVLIFSSVSVFAGEILIDDYVDGLSPKWVRKSFKGKTRYEVTREDNQLCVKATSSASASALYYKIKYDTNDFPVLTWRWKVDHVLSKGDALQTSGPINFLKGRPCQTHLLQIPLWWP
jgi:hypothetical protein